MTLGMVIFMDFWSPKVYKGLGIKKWNARLIYKNGFHKPEKELTLPLLLFMRKFVFFIF